MKTIIVPVLLSGKKKSCREPLYGDFNVEKKLGPVKVLEDQKNLDFPCGYRSSGPVKVQKFSRCLLEYTAVHSYIYPLYQQPGIPFILRPWPLTHDL